MVILDLNKYQYTQPWYVNSEIRRNLLKFTLNKKKYNILEIGCFEGLSACGFSDNIMDHDDSTLDCVDPFILSNTDPRITTSGITNNTEKMFINNIKNSKNSNKIFFHKLESDEFFRKNTKKFNFIYVDGCHEVEFIKNDINNSFSVLEIGGILWLDDYKGNSGALKVVMDNVLEKYKDCFKQIQGLDYQFALIKTKNYSNN
jgi:hypothetical protein